MLADRGMPVWLIGGKQDAAIGDYIESLTEGAAVNLCGKTDLAQALDLISLARVAVTNDSGLMHVAAALGVPVVALFGSSSPAYTPPLSEDAIAMTLALPCSPCFKRTCPLKHTRCLNDLHPDAVIDNIDRLLTGRPSMSAA
ncbi:MAG: ADP-heptose--LPS heptosyltransferase 2 [Pseudomonadota bacterium]|jgi:heptosyltransferase-2